MHSQRSRSSVILRCQIPDFCHLARDRIWPELPSPGPATGTLSRKERGGPRSSAEPGASHATLLPAPGPARRVRSGKPLRHRAVRWEPGERARIPLHHPSLAVNTAAAIGCRAALAANSVRACKSSLSQRFLWRCCMQIDVIARVGVAWPRQEVGGGVRKLVARLVWRLGIQIRSSQSRGARSAIKGECPQFLGPFPLDPHKQWCKNEVNCWAWKPRPIISAFGSWPA